MPKSAKRLRLPAQSCAQHRKLEASRFWLMQVLLQVLGAFQVLPHCVEWLSTNFTSEAREKTVQLLGATLPLHHHPSTAVPSLHIEGFGELQLWRLVLHGGVNQLQRSNVVVETACVQQWTFCDTQLLVGASTVCIWHTEASQIRDSPFSAHMPAHMALLQRDGSTVTLSALCDSVAQWRNANFGISSPCNRQVSYPNHSLFNSLAEKRNFVQHDIRTENPLPRP